MGRTLSEILKDRNCFTEEQEQAIHKAVQKEIEEYRKAGLLEDLKQEQ